ncbi:MAG: class I SAM-dependent methyltransferase [Candidatus Aegiribacteria sp.]|nr:class I SAM-dependent methyltransferase [Candidatus Aegiribacteria sp.]
MIDDISDIVALYNSDPEKEHIRLERHQLEHDITLRYLNRYLPHEGSILEVGAATGRYTLELAGRGHTLTAVDISEKLIERCRKRIEEQGLEKHVQFLVADARDLNEVPEKEFDAVLLMGPLYHLVEDEDRKTALREAFSRLREGGIIFSSFISRFGILGGVLKLFPEWIENQPEVRSVIEKGSNPENLRIGDFRGYFATVSEIVPLHQGIGFETLVLAGVEPAISADDESYNSLQGKRRQLWLDLFFEASTKESVIGASRHLLYIGRKREK